MKQRSAKVIGIFSSFFYNILFVFAGAFVLHLSVRVVTLAYFKSGKHFDIHSIDLLKIYSMDMLPNIISYSLLLMMVYSLFLKTKRMMQTINYNEIKKEKDRAVLSVTQELAGVIVDSISESNNEIIEWVERRKNAGKAPEDVERASHRIAQILKAFSETSFMLPYTGEKGMDGSTIDKLILKISEIKELPGDDVHKSASERSERVKISDSRVNSLTM